MSSVAEPFDPSVDDLQAQAALQWERQKCIAAFEQIAIGYDATGVLNTAPSIPVLGGLTDYEGGPINATSDDLQDEANYSLAEANTISGWQSWYNAVMTHNPNVPIHPTIRPVPTRPNPRPLPTRPGGTWV